MKIKIVAFVSSLLAFSNANAGGEIDLYSDNWDYICKVEVMTGLQAPESGKIQTYEDVEFDESTPLASGKDRVCYKRSRFPSQCESQLTVWTCKSNPTPCCPSRFSVY